MNQADQMRLARILFEATSLTEAQRKLLADVRRDGVRVYNGRAARPIRALEHLGLVTVDWDMIPQAKGGGIELVHRITVRPNPR